MVRQEISLGVNSHNIIDYFMECQKLGVQTRPVAHLSPYIIVAKGSGAYSFGR